MKRRLLVTGVGGFVGGHLQQWLANWSDSPWQLVPPRRHDLTNPATLDAWLADACPDAVIHLAGQTFVPEAFRDPARTLQVNVLGTLNLLEALKRRGFDGTFLYVSSGDVYGQVAEADLPITERQPPQPRNPYAVSKLSAELLCLQWSHVEPWRIIVARPFNHIGVGQNASFVVSSIARQLARMKLGLQEPVLQVGDVDVTRDFLDVRDVLNAYFLLLEKGRNGEIYNVCSGQERRIRDLITEMSRLAEMELEIAQDPARLRRADQRRVVGSSDKLQNETGWKPGITITETLRSLLSDWENRERKKNEQDSSYHWCNGPGRGLPR
ncbi:GDP-mannose 4,6-dehydratase [Zestomonas thermotolerans]|uniref:GDP-mannose 4,6-dehydratase n=1 Tax=Zestomonas thermotolerans TaxID=157784 RepID=UPI0023F25810|nr:GDP-mannose 4,6-dehydratase [Pseudomonas thermotolerans]